MMWCSRCKDAVEPDFEPYNVQGDEWVDIPRCPSCHGKLYDEVDLCPLCHQPMKRGADVCDACRDDIISGFRSLLDGVKRDGTYLDALDAVAAIMGEIGEHCREWDEEDRQNEEAWRKEARDMFDSFFKIRKE